MCNETEELKQEILRLRASQAAQLEQAQQALVRQRRDLGAQHDDTLAELERVRKVAHDEIERLQSELQQARRDTLDKAIEVARARRDQFVDNPEAPNFDTASNTLQGMFEIITALEAARDKPVSEESNA